MTISCLNCGTYEDTLECCECGTTLCLCCTLIDWDGDEADYCEDCFYLAAVKQVERVELLQECW